MARAAVQYVELGKLLGLFAPHELSRALDCMARLMSERKHYAVLRLRAYNKVIDASLPLTSSLPPFLFERKAFSMQMGICNCALAGDE